MTTFHTLDLSRRHLLRGVTMAVGAGALAAITLAASPAAAGAKFSQKMAQYQPTPKGAQNCANCVQFQPATVHRCAFDQAPTTDPCCRTTQAGRQAWLSWPSAGLDLLT